MSWWRYVARHAAGDTMDQVGAAAGVKGSTVTRWKQGGGVDPVVAARFARHYKRPVLEAFVAAGFLTPTEANEQPPAAPSLDQLSDEHLLDEIRARMRRGSEGDGDAAPNTQAGNARNQGSTAGTDSDSVTSQKREHTHATSAEQQSATGELDPEQLGLAARRTGQPNLGERVDEEDKKRE